MSHLTGAADFDPLASDLELFSHKSAMSFA
jgi:hypothetical protein